MAQQIPGDPRSRETFSFGEDFWNEANNHNWTQTVEQANDMQRVLLGDATPGRLEGYAGNSFLARIIALERANREQEDEIEDLEDDVEDKPDFSQLISTMAQIAVGLTSTSDGANPEGAAVVSLEHASTMKLVDGDTLIFYDPAIGTREAHQVDGEHDEGVPEIALQTSFQQSLGGNWLVLLSPSDIRTYVGEGSLGDFQALRDAVLGDYVFDDVASSQERRLREQTQAIDDQTEQIASIASTVSGFGSTIDTIQDQAEDAANQASDAANSIEDLEGSITSLENEVDSISLEASTFETSDMPILELTQSYDGTGTNSIAVEWLQDAPNKLDAESVLIIEGNGENDGETAAYTVRTTNEDVQNGASSITLDRSYDIDAPNEAPVYMTIVTVASAVSARTNGNITVEGKALKTVEFDGSIVDRGDGFYKFERDNNGEPMIGTQGWAATSGGEFAATNAFLRGEFDVESGSISGPLEMEDDGEVRFVDDWAEIILDHKALSILGRDTSSEHPQPAEWIALNSTSPVTADWFTDYQSATWQTQKGEVLGTHSVGAPGATAVITLSLALGDVQDWDAWQSFDLVLGVSIGNDIGTDQATKSRVLENFSPHAYMYTTQSPSKEVPISLPLEGNEDIEVSVGLDSQYGSDWAVPEVSYDIKWFAPTHRISSRGVSLNFSDQHYFRSEMGETEVGGEFIVNGKTILKGDLSAEPNTNATFDDVRVLGTLTVSGDFVDNTSSDRRVKKNIERIKNGNDLLCRLGGYMFEYNEEAYPTQVGRQQAGIIAQEVEEVLPEAVRENDNGYLGVEYKQLIPLLIEAIKENRCDIDELAKQLKA